MYTDKMKTLLSAKEHTPMAVKPINVIGKVNREIHNLNQVLHALDMINSLEVTLESGKFTQSEYTLVLELAKTFNLTLPNMDTFLQHGNLVGDAVSLEFRDTASRLYKEALRYLGIIRDMVYNLFKRMVKEFKSNIKQNRTLKKDLERVLELVEEHDGISLHNYSAISYINLKSDFYWDERDVFEQLEQLLVDLNITEGNTITSLNYGYVTISGATVNVDSRKSKELTQKLSLIISNEFTYEEVGKYKLLNYIDESVNIYSKYDNNGIIANYDIPEHVQYTGTLILNERLVNHLIERVDLCDSFLDNLITLVEDLQDEIENLSDLSEYEDAPDNARYVMANLNKSRVNVISNFHLKLLQDIYNETNALVLDIASIANSALN